MHKIKLNNVFIVFFILFLTASIALAAQHKPAEVKAGSIDLNHYQLESRIDLAEIQDDLSGITFSPVTQSLFAVTNEPPQIAELSLEGNVKRLITLSGFEDTEGITHISNHRFAVVEERKRQVVFISITSHTRQIKRGSQESYTLPLGGEKNKGLEGVAWSQQYGLLIAKEDEPEQLYQLSNEQSAKEQASSLLSYAKKRKSLEDVAGLHSLGNGNTLFLSEASRTLLELSKEGQVLSKKLFEWRISEPFKGYDYIEQPEGVTLSADNRLYIVSEPNQLLIFNKPQS